MQARILASIFSLALAAAASEASGPTCPQGWSALPMKSHSTDHHHVRNKNLKILNKNQPFSPALFAGTSRHIYPLATVQVVLQLLFRSSFQLWQQIM